MLNLFCRRFVKSWLCSILIPPEKFHQIKKILKKPHQAKKPQTNPATYKSPSRSFSLWSKFSPNPPLNLTELVLGLAKPENTTAFWCWFMMWVTLQPPPPSSPVLLKWLRSYSPAHSCAVNQCQVLSCWSQAADWRGAGGKEPVILKCDLSPLLVLNITAPLPTDTSHFTANAFS